MKRTPFYRRPGRTGQFSGLRERVIWMIQTRGRPVTGSEIAEKFGVTLIEFNRVANGITRGSGQIAQIVQVHFGLQEDIKKYYKLRGEGDNLARAEHLCEQMIALSELAFPALRHAHDKRVEEYESLTGNKYPSEFYPPSHYGYSQLSVILKKRKELQRNAALSAHRIDHNAVSAEYCAECDEQIPEPRRAAVPGCQTCADCQSVIELKNKQRGM